MPVIKIQQDEVLPEKCECDYSGCSNEATHPIYRGQQEVYICRKHYNILIEETIAYVNGERL